MTTTFLERNKKKSLLAALLLFLRQHKALVLLLLVVLLGTTLFLSPSSMLMEMPGGARFVAGVAWLAQKVGIDLSKWGLSGPGGPRSFEELLAAFRAAKSRAGGPGWDSFFRSRGGPAVPSSLDFVKGSQADLAAGAGAGGAGSGQIQGAVDAEEAKKDDGAVQLSQGDMGGQREGFVKNAFAGGFVNGLLGGGASGAALGGTGGLSGMAYAGRGFFSGGLPGASSNGSLAQSGLQGLPSAGGLPSSAFVRGTGGHLSASQRAAIATREMQGASRAAGVGSNRAFGQLAQDNSMARLASTPNCASSNCPGEYASTTSGAVYDGNATNTGSTTTDILTAPTVDGMSAPNVPNTALAQGYLNQANQMQQDAQTCRNLDNQYDPQENYWNQQMQSLSQQFASANCGSGGCNQSKYNYCNGIANNLRGACQQYMNLRCQHTRACPLTAASSGTTCSQECQQVGNGVTAQQVVVNPDETSNADAQGFKTQ